MFETNDEEPDQLEAEASMEEEEYQKSAGQSAGADEKENPGAPEGPGEATGNPKSAG